MNIPRPVVALALLATTACASGGSTPGARDPLARLEQERTRNPKSVAALRALGIAYYKADRPGPARDVLREARTLAPKDGAVALYLGLANEKLNDLAGAKEAYGAYLATGKSRNAKAQIRARLGYLQRQELAAQARAALAQEATLDATATSPTTIAVPPLSVASSDTSLAPIGRGLADLLITDLSRSAKLTVVERDRMQALLAEIDRGSSGRVDSATAARAGKLLRAGRVVQGAVLELAGERLQVTTAVVDVPTAKVGGAVQADDRLEQLFALEKQIVLRLFQELGVELTPAERQLVEQRPTRSLQAFLAYSRGLEAEDAGRFDDAERFYNSAVRLDPGFGGAATRAQGAQAAQSGGQVTAGSVEAAIVGSAEGAAAAAATSGQTAALSGTSATLATVVNDVNPSPIGNQTTTQTTNAGNTSTSPATTTGTSTPSTSGTVTTPPAPPVRLTGTVTIVVTRP